MGSRKSAGRMTTNIGLIPRKEGHVQIGKLILLLVLAGLLLLTLTRPYLTLSGAIPHDVASSIRQKGYILLLILSITALGIDKRFTRTVPVPLPIVVLLLWCWFSLLWSASPTTSQSRLILTTSVVWLAFICVDRLNVQRSLLLIRVFFGMALLANYALVFLDPMVGIANAGSPDHLHEWRGFMGHKNIAGTVAALTGLVFLFNGSTASRVPRYAIVIAAMIFLGFTQSLTSIIGMLVATIAGGAIYQFGSRIAELKSHQLVQARRIGILLCVLAAAGLVLVTLNGGVLLDIVANPNFWTGRGRIWQPMLITYFEHPALGTGYGAFWAQSQDVNAITSDGSNLNGVTQGHNGYLDLAIQIGLPGLLLALIGVAAWPAATFVRAARSDVATGALAIAALVFFLINNVAETSLFDGDQIPQVFAMLALAMLAATVKRRKVISREKLPVRRSATRTGADGIPPAHNRRRRRESGGL